MSIHPTLTLCFIRYIVFLSTVGGILNAYSQSSGNTKEHWRLIPNQGQWEGTFLYKAQVPGGYFFLENDGYTLRMDDVRAMDAVREILHHRHFMGHPEVTLRSHAIRFQWIGCLKDSIEVVNEQLHSFCHHYYLGNDARKWKTGVPVAKEVRVKRLYEGVDWLIKGADFIPKHDMIIMDGMVPENLLFTIRGAHKTYVDRQGRLVIETSLGKIKESKPIAWQLVEGVKHPVKCRYRVINDTTFGFDVKQQQKGVPLIIDPELIFSTYSGSLGDNFGFTATYDSKGHLYAGGIVDGNDGEYPWTLGAFQTTYGGSTGGQPPINLPCDMSISKYAPDGSSLIYASYLGGDRNEHPHSLVVDTSDNLLIFGTSNSGNFPVDSLAFDPTINGLYDMVLVKLSEDGSRMLGGTFIGGNNSDGINDGTLKYNFADDFRGDVFVDSFNMIYVAATSRSRNFPTTSFSVQPTHAGGTDAVVFKIDSLLQNLLWSTFIGGSNDDAAYSVKVIDGMVYVAGGTASPNIERYGNGAFPLFLGGVSDGFITSLSADSGIMNTFSFYGTTSYDQIYFLDYDSKKNLYVSGQTKGVIPRTSERYGQDNTGQFIARFNSDLKSIDFQTTFGFRTANNKPDLCPSAFLVDKCDNVYFSGWGSFIFSNSNDNNSGSTRGLPVSTNAIQRNTDENDFYLIVLGNELKDFVYATYYGGNMTNDHVDGGTSRFDKDGVIYQSVCSSCPASPAQSYLSDFPVTRDAVFTQNFSRRCSNAAFKIDFKKTYNVKAEFEADPIEGCSPLEVNFTNRSFGGKTYFWDFGDSNTDSIYSPFHTYTEKGTYKVQLLVIDSISCNRLDTAYGTITVLSGPDVDFDYEQEPCDLTALFLNKSSDSISYQWDLGDGTTTQEWSPKHKYPFGGMYKVILKATHLENDCVDSSAQVVTFPSNPFTKLEIPNVFTPNNDGLNDCYTVKGLSEDCESGEIIIYNRWGDKVYQGDLATSCWNGKVFNKGEDLPSGVYFYLIDTERVNGKRGVKTNGTIQLIRN
jgi:gliding motility-associated-like protein